MSQALDLAPLGDAEVVAGRGGMGREIRWAHVVDVPDPLPWVAQGQLLLTTGFSWPSSPDEQRCLVRELGCRGLSGVAMAVPKYFSHFPDAAKQAGDRAELPLLELPWEITFSTVTQAVNRTILAEQYALIEESIRVHQELTKAAVAAGSLQDLIDTLGRLIDREILLEDPDHRVLAAWPSKQTPDTIRRATVERGRSPAEVIPKLDLLGHLERIRRRPGPVRIPADEDMQLHSGVACPIWLRNELVGTVWIVEGDHELSDLHVRAAEHAAMLAALHIANQRQVSSVEVRFGSTFLDALLEGKFQSTPNNLERARLFGFSTEAAYRVGLLVPHSDLPLNRDGVLRRDRAAERLRQRLGGIGEIPITSSRLNQIAFLIGETVPPESAWDLESDELHAGLALGRGYVGADGVRQSYLEALSISSHAESGQLCRYEEMLVLRVLSGDLTARDAFLDQLFGPAAAVKGGARLVNSLLTLAECGFHRRRAAAALHVHPNTLRYRLERAGEVLHLDPTEPETQFRLQLAMNLVCTAHNRPADFWPLGT